MKHQPVIINVEDACEPQSSAVYQPNIGEFYANSMAMLSDLSEKEAETRLTANVICNLIIRSHAEIVTDLQNMRVTVDNPQFAADLEAIFAKFNSQDESMLALVEMRDSHSQKKSKILQAFISEFKQAITYLSSTLVEKELLEKQSQVLKETQDKLMSVIRELGKQRDEQQCLLVKLEDTQDQLLHSKKLEAIGTLAAGIAHDFNNLLGSIIGYVEMASDEFPDDSFGKKCLQQVLVAGFRSRDLVSRMLTFARQTPVNLVQIDVVSEIRESLTLLNVSYKPQLEFSFVAGKQQFMVWAGRGQLQQIVMNLCINAADAMQYQGVVDIRVDALKNDTYVQGKPAICLTVADSGHGMTPEILERIFDPFFTTKAPNRGSGLGLSMVHGIVTQMGGNIEVKSCVDCADSGTEFRIILPLVEVSADNINPQTVSD